MTVAKPRHDQDGTVLGRHDLITAPCVRVVPTVTAFDMM